MLRETALILYRMFFSKDSLAFAYAKVRGTPPVKHAVSIMLYIDKESRSLFQLTSQSVPDQR